MTFGYLKKKSVKKIKVSLKSEKKYPTLREDQYTVLIISRPVLRRSFTG
jgi:hypothetical protein